MALRFIATYLEAAGHGCDGGGAMFRPIKNTRTGSAEKALHPESVHQCGVLGRSVLVGSQQAKSYGPMYR